MRNIPSRPRAARRGVFFAGLLLAGFARAATPPEPPEPPEPPTKPEVSLKGITVRPGETRKGDIVQVTPGSVNIEGTLDGDLWVAAPQVRISGVVTGDVFTAASDVNVTGEIKKSLRCAGANVVLDGIVDGGVVITGGTLMIGSKAHVAENVTAYGGQMTHHGIIDDTLTFAGGTAILGGKVQGDANITADAIEIEPGARIEGDVSYSTRKQMDAAIKAITGGDVAFEEKPIRERHALRERHHDGFHPSKFGIGVRIAFFVASFLFGCALLALFKQHEAKINDAIGNDTLRSAGLGFVSILVTIAVCLSGILILTLPFIAIYLLAYLFMVYLAKTPVAVWIGRKIFALAHRSTGPYVALLVGLVVLHLVFMIPVLGAVAWFAVALLGLGAMISVYIAQRQARKAAQASAALPEAPPAAS